MTTILAAQDGNWSAGATWTGGVIPGAADIAMANGKTVTINQNISVTNLGCSTFGGAVSGGYFLVPAAISITCSNPLGPLANATSWGSGMIRCSHAVGTMIDVYADVTRAENSDNIQLFRPVTGKVGGITIHGSIVIPSTSTTTGITVIISSNNPYFSTITVTGAVTAGAYVATNSPPIDSALTSTIIDLQGTLTAKPGRACAKATGVINRVKTLVGASDGTDPLWAPGRLMQSGTQCTWTCMDDQLAAPFTPGQAVVMSNFTSDSPPPSDVRAGKTYGPSGTLTGTCAIPDPGTVAVSVPVDATVGTAMLRPADVAAVTGAQIAAAVTA